MEPKTAVTLPLEKTYKKLTYGQNLTEWCLGAHMEMALPTLQPGHTPHPLISSPGRLNMTITMASANGNKNHITQTGCTEMLSRHTLPIPVWSLGQCFIRQVYEAAPAMTNDTGERQIGSSQFVWNIPVNLKTTKQVYPNQCVLKGFTHSRDSSCLFIKRFLWNPVEWPSRERQLALVVAVYYYA